MKTAIVKAFGTDAAEADLNLTGLENSGLSKNMREFEVQVV